MTEFKYEQVSFPISLKGRAYEVMAAASDAYRKRVQEELDHDIRRDADPADHPENCVICSRREAARVAEEKALADCRCECRKCQCGCHDYDDY